MMDRDAQFILAWIGGLALLVAAFGFASWVTHETPRAESPTKTAAASSPEAPAPQEPSSSFPEAAAVTPVEAPEVVKAQEGPRATDTPVERLERGEWWAPTLIARIKAHRNGPWILIPKTARTDELQSFAIQAEAICQYHQEVADALWASYGGDLVSFSKDPRVLQNDQDRQEKLMNTVRSLWPKAGGK